MFFGSDDSYLRKWLVTFILIALINSGKWEFLLPSNDLELDQIVAGVDEAGRGPLAGPVVAAACILPWDLSVEGIRDSKKMTSAQRARAYHELIEAKEVIWGLGVVDEEEIDRLNVFQATLAAMRMAVKALAVQPQLLLVDGTHTPETGIFSKAIVKGEDKYLCIAAASILAKVTRDKLMLEYHQKWPEYGFDRHKGYGTRAHLEAIHKYGPCPIHRRSFAPISGIAVSIP